MWFASAEAGHELVAANPVWVATAEAGHEVVAANPVWVAIAEAGHVLVDANPVRVAMAEAVGRHELVAAKSMWFEEPDGGKQHDKEVAGTC